MSRLKQCNFCLYENTNLCTMEKCRYYREGFVPKKEIASIIEECIDDFEEIINNTHFIINFDGLYECLIFNKAIEEYKKKLNEKLEKYKGEKIGR